MKRQIFLTTLFLLSVCNAMQAENIVIESGDWKISYIESSKSFRINHKKEDGSYRPVFINSIPEATYDLGEVKGRTITSATCSAVEYRAMETVDEFGIGIAHTFLFSENTNKDGVTLMHRICVYPDKEYLITDLCVIHPNGLKSNFLAPICTGATSYTMYVNNSNNRMLKVPFDNDGFGRYQRYKMNCEMTSYEVSSLYEGESRNGLVVGSVDHNRWKSAVKVNATNNGKINKFKLLSGVSDTETRDIIPHGKVQGDTVRSARFFVGFYVDWRDGMEAFAKANNLVAPKRSTWTGGTPFGWQSWGVMAEKNSYDADIEISDYYHTVLQPGGFANSQGNIIFSLDASDGMNDTEHRNFIAHAKENGQMVGCYSTPFSLWWQDNELDRHIYTGSDGTKYNMRDVVLHVNGNPYKYDGAFCRDPTHPATKADIANFMRSAATYGYKYVKCDFTNCGIIQADYYFDKNVTTAVEAYNQGLAYLIKQADKYGLFIAFSISPLFPYQYANSRRVACDTWGRIGWTEYGMNAITAGWWTDGLYQYNDPDHLVLVGNGDQAGSTLGENRARYTNGAVTGMMLVADNFSLSDKSGRGDAPLSRQRATQVLFNKDINEMADLGRSFRPVYGYKEYNGNADGAESFVMHHTDRYLYVAIINYNSSGLNGSIPLTLLDITTEKVEEIVELWTSTPLTVTESLSYKVPGKDARVYRFTKKGISTMKEDMPAVESLRAHLRRTEDGRYLIHSSYPMRTIEVFSPSGSMLACHEPHDDSYADFSVDMVSRFLLVRITYKDGYMEEHKIL